MTAILLGSAATFKTCVAEKATFVLLNVVDVLLTVFAMSIGFTELNPFMQNLLDNPVQLFLAKCAIPLLIAWLAPGKLLIPAIIAMAIVVGWDIKELVQPLL